MSNTTKQPALAGQVDRELGPLPEPDAMDEGYDFTRYSDDAMRAYAAQEVAAERERCCRVVVVQCDDARLDVARRTILAIRAGDDYHGNVDRDGLLRA